MRAQGPGVNKGDTGGGVAAGQFRPQEIIVIIKKRSGTNPLPPTSMTGARTRYAGCWVAILACMYSPATRYEGGPTRQSSRQIL